MATALRPDSRRVAEATPAAMTAAFLFEAAVQAKTGGGSGGGDGGASASIDVDGEKVDAGGLVRTSRRRKKQPKLAPSTAALSHSLALAAGKLSRSTGAPLPRGASHALCGRCGKVLGGPDDEVEVTALSHSCLRRRRRAAAAAKAKAKAKAQPPSRRGGKESASATTKTPSSELNTVALVVSCGSCGQRKKPRGFYARELAEAAAAALRRGS